MNPVLGKWTIGFKVIVAYLVGALLAWVSERLSEKQSPTHSHRNWFSPLVTLMVPRSPGSCSSQLGREVNYSSEAASVHTPLAVSFWFWPIYKNCGKKNVSLSSLKMLRMAKYGPLLCCFNSKHHRFCLQQRLLRTLAQHDIIKSLKHYKLFL